MTRGELEQRMTVDELRDWLAHDRLGDPRRRRPPTGTEPTLDEMRSTMRPTPTRTDP